MVAGLENRGHRCRLTFYDPRRTQSPAEVLGILRHFPRVKADRAFDVDTLGPSDALIATSWPTAYPVAAAPGQAKRLYFVQDYEPSFYPAGSQASLAEGSYRLGLQGITMGPWLTEKLSSRFGMACEPISFEADLDEYSLSNRGPRPGVLFYARPLTPRRGYELGVLALERFIRASPGAEVHLVGGELGHRRPRLPHTSHGILSHRKLNELYNRCSAGLVLSLTNVSLLPLELLAAGCIPVVNDSESTRAALDNRFIRYAQASPGGLASALSTAYESARAGDLAADAAASVSGATWTRTVDQLESAIARAVRRPVVS
ncbi:MAG TPA: hypothetical protein VMZ51_00590 [Acidimicrobiales bacterium]|nr:hypothetical protein [Acidimicrobiales bacterium]